MSILSTYLRAASPRILLSHKRCFVDLRMLLRLPKSQAHPPTTYDMNAPPSSHQLVARIQKAQSLRGFSDENIADMREFYTALNSCAAYELDVAWVSHPRASVSPELRGQVLTGLQNCALDTRFQLNAQNKNPPTSIALHDVIGHLAGDAWLNDAVLVFVLRQIADELDHVFVLDSLRPIPGTPRPTFKIPSTRMNDRQMVVFPVNVAKSHWCLIIATVSADGVGVTLYDPLAMASYIAALQHEWSVVCEPLVRAWAIRDRGEYVISSADILTSPRQAGTDSINCGVYCIATACDFASQSTTFRSMPTFDPEYIAFLRTWLLRNLLCNSSKPSLANEEWATTIMARLARAP